MQWRSISCLKLSFKILTRRQPWYFDHNSASKSASYSGSKTVQNQEARLQNSLALSQGRFPEQKLLFVWIFSKLPLLLPIWTTCTAVPKNWADPPPSFGQNPKEQQSFFGKPSCRPSSKISQNCKISSSPLILEMQSRKSSLSILGKVRCTGCHKND